MKLFPSRFVFCGEGMALPLGKAMPQPISADELFCNTALRQEKPGKVV